MYRIHLKKGRERPVMGGHPWIFSGAIEKTEESPDNDPVVDVLDYQGRWLARGLYNPKSQIRVRLLTGEQEAIDAIFFSRRAAAPRPFRARKKNSVDRFLLPCE